MIRVMKYNRVSCQQFSCYCIKTVWTDINAQNVLLPINTAPTQTNSVLAVSSFVLNAKGF